MVLVIVMVSNALIAQVFQASKTYELNGLLADAWVNSKAKVISNRQNKTECDSIVITIINSSQSERVGVKQIYSAVINGGMSPYSFDWDINNDGITDGDDSKVEVIYNHKYVNEVKLKVIDAVGCLKQKTLSVYIKSPEILPSSIGAAIEVCGNNDDFIDPGEQWSAPVTLQNTGEVSAKNTEVVITKSDASSMVNLESPIIHVGDLESNQQISTQLGFSLPQDAVCGQNIELEIQAAVYTTGFNQISIPILSAQVGNNRTCEAISYCESAINNKIIANDGLWFNPNRPGNGYDLYTINNELIYVQYTALIDHSPIWYLSDFAKFQNNQADNQLMKFSYDGAFGTSQQASEVVGDSLISLMDPNHAVLTQTINGAFSAEIITLFQFSHMPTNLQRTGLWYNPTESGWGQTITTQGDTGLVVNYLYDDVGQPFWVLGSGQNSIEENTELHYVESFCPDCPWLPTQLIQAGNIQIMFHENNHSGEIQNMHISLDNIAHKSQWDRVNLPINLLTSQQPSVVSGHLKYFGFTLIDVFWDDPIDGVEKLNYADEVNAFTNLADILVRDPFENIISRMNVMHSLQLKSLLHLNDLFFEQVGMVEGLSGNNYNLRSDYQERWDTFVATNNLIDNQNLIQAFYIGEEPTWNSISYSDLKAATDYVKNTIKDVPIMLVEAYPAIDDLQVPDSVDWVGFDHYFVKDPKNDANYKDELETLKSKLNTMQKVVIIMDTHYIASLHGASGIALNDMTAVANSYYELAQQESKAIALIGYFWPSGFDDPQSIGARNMPNSTKDEYHRIGKLITGKE
jgi:hypothetical protein